MNDIARESFIAIRSFLEVKENYRGGLFDVTVAIDNRKFKHEMNDRIEVTFYEADAIYTLYSNCFYECTKTSKIESSDYLFEWDGITKELFTHHNSSKILIKRK